MRTRAPESSSPDGGARVKLETFGRPIPDLLSFAQLLYTSMEGNPNFSNPQTPQDELAAILAEADADTAKASRLKALYAAAITRRDQMIERLLAAIDKRGSYVQLESRGNAAVITSAGIDVRKTPQPTGALAPPDNLQVELNGVAGAVVLTWDQVKKARGYMLEYGPVDGPKQQEVVLGQRKVRLSLDVGVTYQFRLATIGGSSGQSPWGAWVTRGAA